MKVLSPTWGWTNEVLSKKVVKRKILWNTAFILFTFKTRAITLEFNAFLKKS